MIFIWIIFVLLYLVFNSIIALSWMVEFQYEKRTTAVMVAVLLILFGLPLMIIIFIVATAMYVVGKVKKDE